MNDIFLRTRMLLGDAAMDRLASSHVAVFGLGGVGSYAVEALARSGVGELTLVDRDTLSPSNINRQLYALHSTVGQPKAEVAARRCLDINPALRVHTLCETYDADHREAFFTAKYDFIIDAIDSLKDKADLILRATALPKEITFISSMGAALRTDPFMVRKAEFWKVDGDPLARALRKKFKKNKTFPRRKFQCVYSEEKPMQNQGVNKACGTGGCLCPKAKLLSGERGTDTAVYDAPGDQQLVEHEWCSTKAQINGSLCHITATFGMAIAGMVINHIIE